MKNYFLIVLALLLLTSCKQPGKTDIDEVKYLDNYNYLFEDIDMSKSLADASGQTYPWSGVDSLNVSLMDQAVKDIEQYRKGNFSIKFLDEKGIPVDAHVELKHVKHEFKFGLKMIDSQDEDSLFERSASSIMKIFNAANICNYHSTWWKSKDKPYGNWDNYNKKLEWCEKLELDPRFHIIQYIHMGKPVWWKEIDTEEELWDFYEKRAADVAKHYSEGFFEYDVMNEMIHWPIWFEKYDGAKHNMDNYFVFNWMKNPENGAKVVEQARKHFPSQKLVVLETGVWNDYPNNKVSQDIYTYYKRLVELNAPFDVIGYQGRYNPEAGNQLKEGNNEIGPRMFYMESIKYGFELFSGLGKEISITEFAPPSRTRKNKIGSLEELGVDRRELALWVANFHILAFSKPYLNQITWWPYLNEDSGVISEDGSLSETGQVLDVLINEKWHTHINKVTKNGYIDFRGFYGEYLITAEGYAEQILHLFSNDSTAQTVTLKKL